MQELACYLSNFIASIIHKLKKRRSKGQKEIILEPHNAQPPSHDDCILQYLVEEIKSVDEHIAACFRGKNHRKELTE